MFIVHFDFFTSIAVIAFWCQCLLLPPCKVQKTTKRKYGGDNVNTSAMLTCLVPPACGVRQVSQSEMKCLLKTTLGQFVPYAVVGQIPVKCPATLWLPKGTTK